MPEGGDQHIADLQIRGEVGAEPSGQDGGGNGGKIVQKEAGPLQRPQEDLLRYDGAAPCGPRASSSRLEEWSRLLSTSLASMRP